MKKAKILAGILAAMTLLTACSNGEKPEQSQPPVTSAPESVTTPKEETTPAPETTPEPESTPAPETTPAEPTAEPEPEEQPQAAEFIGKTIGELEEAYSTTLEPDDGGYMGCHTFQYVDNPLDFKPLAAELQDNYKDSVITAIFTNKPCPLYNGISGCSSYNEIVNAVGADVAGEPMVNDIDGSVILMFDLDGYRFMVSWSDYVDFDSPCYSITIDKNVG